MDLSVDNMRPNLDILQQICLQFLALWELSAFLLTIFTFKNPSGHGMTLQPGHGQQKLSVTTGGREANTVTTTFSPSLPV